MALSSRLVWEVRPTGSANNGGGFNVTAAGTDRSQQDTAQVNIDNSTITTSITANVITFTGYVPTSADVGNVVNMLTGTNVTAGRYEITAVGATTWTVTGAATLPTSGTTTNATGKMGGCVALPSTIAATVVAGNIIYVKAGSGYSIASTQTLSSAGSDGAPITWIGYTTTRSDSGQVTFTWTGSANGTVVDVSGGLNIIRNFIIDGNAKSADRGLRLNAVNCVGINLHAKNCGLTGLEAINTGTLLYRCSATTTGTSTGSGGFGLLAGGMAHSCVAFANAKNGFAASNSVGYMINCIARGNTTNGFYCAGTGGFWAFNCVSHGNTLDGLRLDGSPEDSFLTIYNTIFSSNSGYGINSTSVDYSVAANAQMAVARRFNNAFYNNTSGLRNQFPSGAGDITLTVDPFTSASTFDFSLNGTTGGGASLRGAGVPGSFGTLASPENSIGYADVGAVQTLGAAPASTTVQTLRSLWRQLTGEQDTTVVPDTDVDIYIQAGLEALNRFVGYHMTTDTTTVVFVNGTQEYSIPADCLEMLWIEYNNKLLDKTSAEEWQRQSVNWRGAKRGMPTEWAIYANKLIFYPTPDAPTVALAASPTLRYVSTPPSFTTNGPDQLASQDWRIAVYYGVAEWSRSYPDSAFAAKRGDDYQQKFDVASQAISLNYKKREVQQ